MKKTLILLTIFLMTGCTDLSNTPIKKTEELLKKYQTLDNAVMTDLNNVIADEVTFSESQKEIYKDIMKKHYQNMTYEIKEDEIDGNEAEVTVEIEVTDFKRVLDNAEIYLQEHQEEFLDEVGNFDSSKYNDYKLERLKETKEKVKYTIEIELIKVDDEWRIDKLEQETLDKINGVYNY